MQNFFKKFFSAFFLLISSLTSIAQPVNYQWANSFGGSEASTGKEVAIDLDNNVFVTSIFNGNDCLVSKYDQDGSLEWTKELFPDSHKVLARSIKTDHCGNLYIVGGIYEPVPQSNGSTSTVPVEAFVQKITTDGIFSWNYLIGGDPSEACEALAMDINSLGDIILSGKYRGIMDFDENPNPSSSFILESALYQSSHVYSSFVIKINEAGSFAWAKSFDAYTCSAMKFSNDDSIILAGSYKGTIDFDPGPLIYNLTGNNNNSFYFVLKLDFFGDLIWAKSLAEFNSYDYLYSISIDKSGSIYLAGDYTNYMYFESGSSSFNLTSNGLRDIFVAKLASNGDLKWTKSIGGTEDDFGESIVCDPLSNIYITGKYNNSVDFDTDTSDYYLSSPDFDNSYVLKLDSEGNFIWVMDPIQSTGDNTSYGICLDRTGNILLTGKYYGLVDFFSNSNSNGNAFLMKFNQDNIPIDQFDYGEDIMLFPNPNNGFVYFKKGAIENANLNVYNINGQLINTYSVSDCPVKLIELKGASGPYVIEVIANEFHQFYKLIKR